MCEIGKSAYRGHPVINPQPFGHDNGVKFKYPWIIPGIGSTDIAKNNGEGLAIGSARAGTGLTIGENVVGMDVLSEIKSGKTVDKADCKRRVKLYKDYQQSDSILHIHPPSGRLYFRVCS